MPRRLDGELVLSGLSLAAILVLGALPLLRLLVEALAPAGRLDPGLFLHRLARPATLRAALHTLDTSACGALLALAIGGPYAVLVALTDLPGRRALALPLLLPLMIAPQVTALAWLHLVGPSSVLLGALHLAPPPGTPNPLLGRGGIVALFGVQHAPIVFVTLRAGLARVPRELVEAAQGLGATKVQALRRAVLPLVLPHVGAALLLAFVSGLGNFGIPAFLGPPAGYQTLTTLLYERLSSSGPAVLPEVAALSVLLCALAGSGLLAQGLLLRGRPTRLEGGASPRFPLGRWRRGLGVAAWGGLMLMLGLPVLSLLATALVPAFGVPLGPSTATLSNFAEVLVRQPDTVRALRVSLLLAGGAAIILGGLSVVLARTLRGCGPGIRRLLETVAEFPYAMPGLSLAIACILLFLRPLPLIGSLYGTPALILVAYCMHFLALALRPTAAAVAAQPREVEEAAASLGAGALRRLVSVTAPLAAPAAVAGALLVFMSAFNELTVSALLWSNGSRTLGVVLYSLEEAGLGPQAAALGVATIAVVGLVLAVLDRLGRRLPPGVLPWR